MLGKWVLVTRWVRRRYMKNSSYTFIHICLEYGFVLRWARIRNIKKWSYVFNICLHLLREWVFVLRWVRGRYALHISLCILFFLMWFMMDLYEVREWGFSSLLIFSLIILKCHIIMFVLWFNVSYLHTFYIFFHLPYIFS